jgi:murein L,D-transpeptidase YcbB/YkuD
MRYHGLLRLVLALFLLVPLPASAQRAPIFRGATPYLTVHRDVLLGDAALVGQQMRWRPDQARRLLAQYDRAAADGLPELTPYAAPLRDALADGSLLLIDVSARRAALRLLEARRSGCCHAAARRDWDITDDALPPAEAAIDQALASNKIDELFATADPTHPFYAALRLALRTEADPARRSQLMLNMDRWRWMPRQLGQRYILVNAPAFEAGLWENGVEVQRWRAVVGRQRSATPVFSAQVTGVIFNPWWEIPQSIVAEGIGALRRTNPREFARRGYVVENGRFRQRPGPANALGRMKLVMPNGYAVYLHDSPAQALFQQEVRVGSHGCVRVADALSFATALLSTRAGGWTMSDSDAVVAAGRTRSVNLDRAIPVYIAYFTAEPAGDGSIRYLNDIYGRDLP